MYKILTTRDDHIIAWLTALAITIHIAEAALPSFFPGIKPGLANIVTIAALIQFGWRIAAWISLLRVLVGSILIGTFLTPTFILSLSGAVASIVVLRLASIGAGFTGIGYGLLAAMAHISGQFIVAWALFIPHQALWKLFPVLLTLSVIFGVISGIIANRLVATAARPDRKPI